MWILSSHQFTGSSSCILKMGQSSLVLLMLQLLVQLIALSSLLPVRVEAQNVSCQSLQDGGACQPSDQECQYDRESDCYNRTSSYRSVWENIDGITVRRCPRDYPHFTPCAAQDSSSINVTGVPPNILGNVTVKTVSLNPDLYYSVNASWTAAGGWGYYEGYEVRLMVNGHTEQCVCIANLSILNFDFLNREYDVPQNLAVKVLPYPLPVNVESRDFARNSTRRLLSPKGCADTDLVSNTSFCNVKRYSNARNLSVQSKLTCSDTKELRVRWDHPPGSPNPPSYFLSLYISMPLELEYIFKVDSATSILIKGVNASLNYAVQLTAYGKCSGLGDLRDHWGEKLGCGRLSRRKSESSLPNPCDLSTTSHPPMPTAATTPIPNGLVSIPLPHQPADQDRTTFMVQDAVQDALPTRESALLWLVSIPVAIAALVTVAVALTAMYLWMQRKATSSEVDPYEAPPMSPDKCKVFVFYCSSLSKREKTHIQRHVVCPLSAYFQVQTPDHFPRGDVSVWLEETLRQAKSVFLVANDQLRSEWSSEARDPVLNTLHRIISAAASYDRTLEKYGIIFTGSEPGEAWLPDNAYLQVMPVFEMSQQRSEEEKVYRFVTGTKQFVFDSTGSTPTTEGPAHVAVCSVE